MKVDETELLKIYTFTHGGGKVLSKCPFTDRLKVLGA